MEPNKIDEIIKQKLENRSMLPKENTWNRLEMLLEEDEKQTAKGGYLKYIVAASVVLFLSFFFFRSQKETINSPQIIVDTPILKKDVEVVVKSSTKKILEEPLVAQETLHAVSQKKTVLTVRKVTKEAVQKEELLVANNNDVEDYSNINLQNTVIAKNTIVKKASMATLNTLDNEVDSLLALAMSENIQKQFKQVTIDKNLAANANALLINVEQELDLSFKDRMFKKIKNGLQKTHTAVVNRNK